MFPEEEESIFSLFRRVFSASRILFLQHGLLEEAAHLTGDRFRGGDGPFRFSAFAFAAGLFFL